MPELQTPRDARVDVFVGDGVYPAALTIGRLMSLEKKCDVGGWVLLERLRLLMCRSEEVQETIRWGLIGGGMSDQRAHELVNTYVVSGRLTEYVPVAVTILFAALYGPPEDPIEGEPVAPTNETPTLED